MFVLDTDLKNVTQDTNKRCFIMEISWFFFKCKWFPSSWKILFCMSV